MMTSRIRTRVSDGLQRLMKINILAVVLSVLQHLLCSVVFLVVCTSAVKRLGYSSADTDHGEAKIGS